MENFWDSSVWGSFLLIGILLSSLLVANVLKRKIPFLRNSLVPNSVLGGILILVLMVAAFYYRKELKQFIGSILMRR